MSSAIHTEADLLCPRCQTSPMPVDDQEPVLEVQTPAESPDTQVLLLAENTPDHATQPALLLDYPANTRRLALDLRLLPHPIRTFYKETIAAMRGDACTLATAGLRSLLEAICQDQNCKPDTLSNRLRQLVSQHLLLECDASYFLNARFIDQESVLDIQPPPPQEFDITLEAAEHLLTTLYVLPCKRSALQRLRRSLHLHRQRR